MSKQIRDQFLSRLPATAMASRQIVETAFGIAENFAPKAEAIKSDMRYTAEGRRDAVKEALSKGAIDHMRQLRGQVESGLAQNKAKRAALGPKAPDRSDVVGHMERAEVRAWLRTLDVADQMRHIMNEASVRAAVLTAPAALSGLRDEEYRHALEIEMEAAHGPALRALDAEETELSELKAAVEIATMRLEDVAGVELPEIRSAAK